MNLLSGLSATPIIPFIQIKSNVFFFSCASVMCCGELLVLYRPLVAVVLLLLHALLQTKHTELPFYFIATLFN